MAADVNFPVSPPRGPRVAQIVAPACNPTDVGRALDLLLNFFLCDQRMHPNDVMEMQALSTTIKASSNNL
jgi:hypothetical protein